jgi:hypothetical protein
MILDLIDMRKNNWKPRNIQHEEEKGPKTLKEIHFEAQKEEYEKQHRLVKSKYVNVQLFSLFIFALFQKETIDQLFHFY